MCSQQSGVLFIFGSHKCKSLCIGAYAGSCIDEQEWMDSIHQHLARRVNGTLKPKTEPKRMYVAGSPATQCIRLWFPEEFLTNAHVRPWFFTWGSLEVMARGYDSHAHADSDRWQVFIKCASEMGWFTMIQTYLPSSIKTGLGFQKSRGRRIHRHIYSRKVA